jgi:hypothetical protein
MLAPWASAQAQGGREEGPIEIEKCQTISQPGSYKLVNNLTFTITTGIGTCLLITADSVTIDLAGFTIGGPIIPSPEGTPAFATAIAAGDNSTGIAVRNGSISDFSVGVDLSGSGSVVEGLRFFRGTQTGIVATGIVKGNTVVGVDDGHTQGVGISATGIVTGNYVSGTNAAGIVIGPGSTVIGNTVTLGNPGRLGISVSCPSNVTDNTVVNKNAGSNLVLNGNGCNDTNNVAP